ncbi:MAG: type VI secretion system membrane subunit TssM [Sandaracinaceae bacterium]|nr:type VI secretion system membrane subunit TssM [Sandaracinaceae bacterium]
MARYLLAGVVVLLVFGVALAFDLPLLVPVGAACVVGLVLVALALVDRIREARRARALAAVLATPPSPSAAGRDELTRVGAEMAGAVNALGKRRLYRLPWYAIIGPPGSGKSTALRESGLTFPGVDASTGPIRGLGGTRNCDWWITNEGVILDTAGRWTSEDEDRQEWLGFLDLIARHRPKRPLDGLIVAVPIHELGADEAAVRALGERLRARIDEVQGRLRLSLPVYLLFTKCDLVEGFVETFGELTKQERGQMWGFTEPLARPLPDPAARFGERFEELVGSLQRRSSSRMAQERRVASRERIFAFPQQMAALREPLAQLVSAVFIDNIYAETPRMRGVYFTSGTQEGRPIDRVMTALAEAMGVPHAAPAAAPAQPKSYFLHDLFTSVVFADVGLARWGAAELTRRRRVELLSAAAVFALALAVGGLPWVAWSANASYLADTAAVVDGVSATADAGAPLDPAALETLGDRARELRRFDERGPPLRMRMGLYPARVRQPVERLYADVIRSRVVRPILEADAHELAAFVTRAEGLQEAFRPEPGELTERYEALEMHLSLTGPGPGEPPIDDALAALLERRLVARWAAMRGADRDQRDAMAPHVRFFVRALREDSGLRLTRHQRVVAGAREVLLTAGDEELATQAILDRVVSEHGAQDMTLRRLLGRELVTVRTEARVPAGFTREVWESYARAMIEDDAAELFGRPWVLGRPPVAPDDVDARVASLRSHYLGRYGESWRAFIDSIEVVEVPADVCGDQLLELTSGTPFLWQLVGGVRDNVDLVPDAAPVSGRRAARTAGQMARNRLERAVAPQLGSHTGAVVDAAEDAVTDALPPADAPELSDEQRLLAAFAGFLSLYPELEPGSRDVPPARAYTEKLDFLRQAVVAPDSVAGSAEARRADARALAEQIIADRPEPWRARVRSLLMPPLAGPVPTPRAATPFWR